jgi:hypothetical protein
MLRAFFIPGLLASASAAYAAEPAQPQPALDPLDFFTGEVRGEGTIKVMMKPAATVRSESRGTPDGKGGMILDQKVYEAGKPVRSSRWTLQPTSKTTLKGTVSNAPGPVSGRLSGNRLHLKYPMAGGLVAEQYMYLQPDRRTLLNHITVRKFGIVVARVEERIRKVP